jgi:hypothetical protein
MVNSETCPACGSTNTSTEHLLHEYSEMRKASVGFFKRNAYEAQQAVGHMLIARGVTHEPNIFGDIPIDVEDQDQPS